jgi:hypothetical protein
MQEYFPPQPTSWDISLGKCSFTIAQAGFSFYLVHEQDHDGPENYHCRCSIQGKQNPSSFLAVSYDISSFPRCGARQEAALCY